MAPTSVQTTCVFDALGYRFSVDAPPALAHHLDDVFGALATEDAAAHRYELTSNGASNDGRSWSVAVDSTGVVTSTGPGTALAHLCSHVNRTAIEACRDRILLHASSAAHTSGPAVVMPASMDSGKTTLVAGLLLAGFDYLSDEAVGIDLVDGTALAYPKPLSIDPGSWPVLEVLRPTEPDLAEFHSVQWHVPSPTPVAWTAPPAAIVSPQYVAGGTIELEPLSRAETLVVLAENSFNLHRFGADGFHVLARLAETCPGYRLRHGDLHRAVDAVTSLLEETVT